MATAAAGSAEETSVSILREDTNIVELAIRVQDLQPRKGVTKLFRRIKKAHHPQELVTNAVFIRWLLTSSGLEMEVKIDPHGDRSFTHRLKIRKFPSEIDDSTCTIEVRQPTGRHYSFLIIRARKRAPAADWKRFLSDNGTLDMGHLDESSEQGQEDKPFPVQHNMLGKTF